MARPTMRRTPRLEGLEGRTLLSADVTDLQQLTIEMINEARVDPAAAADRVEENMSAWAEKAIKSDGDTVQGVLDEIAAAPARPPVAIDFSLAGAARTQTNYQIGIGQQTHDGPAGLATVTDRAIAAGYDDPSAVSENIIYGTASPEQAMRAFLADYGPTNADDPHRENIQQTSPAQESFRDVGVAVVPIPGSSNDGSTSGGAPQYVVTQVFGRKDESSPKLLGVVYDDADADKFYDLGEGVSGARVTITDKATGDATEVTAWSSGGYQADVRPGDYQVDVHLGDRRLATGEATVGQDNVKLDFRVNPAARPAAQVASPAPTPARPAPATSTSSATPPEADTPAAGSTRTSATPTLVAKSPTTPTPILTTPRTLPAPATTTKYSTTEPSRIATPSLPLTWLAPMTSPASTGPDSGPDATSQEDSPEPSRPAQPAPRVTMRMESLLRSGSISDGSTSPGKGRSGLIRGLRAWTLG